MAGTRDGASITALAVRKRLATEIYDRVRSVIGGKGLGEMIDGISVDVSDVDITGGGIRDTTVIQYRNPGTNDEIGQACLGEGDSKGSLEATFMLRSGSTAQQRYDFIHSGHRPEYEFS